MTRRPRLSRAALEVAIVEAAAREPAHDRTAVLEVMIVSAVLRVCDFMHTAALEVVIVEAAVTVRVVVRFATLDTVTVLIGARASVSVERTAVLAAVTGLAAARPRELATTAELEVVIVLAHVVSAWALLDGGVASSKLPRLATPSI